MSRPIRIEFEFATYHVTSRGDRREDIYEDDIDRETFLEIFAKVIERFNWICHSYCLMDNHYHLLIETPDGNLSKGMRHLNGVYTQFSNKRHERVGHIFQGRYKAILVNVEAYLLELSRYIILNPVAAGIVTTPEKWRWSSYRATTGLCPSPPWLTTDSLLAHFGRLRATALKRYICFVQEGIGARPIWENLTQQVYLGDKAFIKKVQFKCKNVSTDINIPEPQRRSPAASLATIARQCKNRNDAITTAYKTGAYSYQDIGNYFGLHFSTIGRVVRKSYM